MSALHLTLEDPWAGHGLKPSVLKNNSWTHSIARFRSSSYFVYTAHLSSSMRASHSHGHDTTYQNLTARVLTWTSTQGRLSRRGSSNPPNRSVSPQASPRDASETPGAGHNGQLRAEDIHRSGWSSSPAPQFHSTHPRSPPERWFSPTFGYQLKQLLHVFFRHKIHEAA
jgi:hypothetical protein